MRPPSLPLAAALVTGAALLGPGPAAAAPDLNITNDQWFSAGPGNQLRVIGAQPGATYRWQVQAGPVIARAGLAQAGAAGVAVLPIGALAGGRYVVRVTPASAPGGTLGRRFGIDAVAPQIAVSLAPGSRIEVNSIAAAAFTCTDPGPPAPPSGVTSCAGAVGAEPIGSGGHLPTAGLGERVLRVRATDAAGNVSIAAIPYAVVDTTAPRAPTPLTPSAATADTRPVFTWSAGADTGVGGTAIGGYRLELSGQPAIPLGADVLSHRWPKPLTKGEYSWRVVAIDAAGNQAASAPVALAIDPTPPPAPTLTSGPSGPTNQRDVTFSWQGVPGASFTWRLVGGGRSGERASRFGDDDDDEGARGRGGTTTTPAVTIRGLEREGKYVFRVAQINPLGVRGPAAAQEFELDLTPPSGVTVWGKPAPGPGVVPNPTFSWTEGDEDGARYLWQVANSAGTIVQGPAVVAVNQAMTSPLRGGSYVFTVAQLDLAGNASTDNEAVAFEIKEPPAPAARRKRATAGQRADRFAPQTVRSGRLTPDLGDRVRLPRPRLAWRSACGGSFYNVQIVRMNGRKVVKVHSGFTRSSRYRVPAGVLKPGNRYYWQVWCWLRDSRRYASRPVGVSYFTQLPARKPRRLLAPAGDRAVAGEALAVRWRAAPRTRFYGVRVTLGERVVFQGRTGGRRMSVAGARLGVPGRYRIVILRGLGGAKSTRYAPAAWAGTALELVAG